MARRGLIPPIALCLAGCGTPRSAAHDPVAERYWGLRKLHHETIRPSGVELATARFRSDGGIDGTAICNSVGTGLIWSPDDANGRGRITNDPGRPLYMTAVGCGEAHETAMADGFWKKMEMAGRWSLQGRRLQIVFHDGSVAELTPVPTPVSQRRPNCAQNNDPNNLDCRD